MPKKAPTRFELVIWVLQTRALPLGYGALFYLSRMALRSAQRWLYHTFFGLTTVYLFSVTELILDLLPDASSSASLDTNQRFSFKLNQFGPAFSCFQRQNGDKNKKSEWFEPVLKLISGAKGLLIGSSWPLFANLSPFYAKTDLLGLFFWFK